MHSVPSGDVPPIQSPHNQGGGSTYRFTDNCEIPSHLHFYVRGWGNVDGRRSCSKHSAYMISVNFHIFALTTSYSSTAKFNDHMVLIIGLNLHIFITNDDILRWKSANKQTEIMEIYIHILNKDILHSSLLSDKSHLSINSSYAICKMMPTTTNFIWSILTVNFSITLVGGRDTLVPCHTLVLLGITRITWFTRSWKKKPQPKSVSIDTMYIQLTKSACKILPSVDSFKQNMTHCTYN